MVRLIQKWLKAGVSEDGQWSETKVGTPQGAVISPLIANVYLHYVFDLWIEAWREKVAKGDVIVVRYADDLVVGFENRMEAERFLREFRERLAKFGLELHPEKTRLIEFGRFAAQNREQRGEKKPETFTFLGFTHHCGKRRKDGAFTVWRTTAKKRMVAKLLAIKTEVTYRRHEPKAIIGEWLQKVTLGYFRYHAIPGNLPLLNVFRHRLRRLWRRVLIQRSQRGGIVGAVERALRSMDSTSTRSTFLSHAALRRQNPRWKPYALKRSYGFVRGVLSDRYPYRDSHLLKNLR